MSSCSGTVFVNGRFVARRRAAVSVFDRGFLYGDGLFETMRSYRGVVFALEDHIERLRASANVFALPVPKLDWASVARELLRRNRLLRRDAWVRLMLTRGPGAPVLMPPGRPRPTTVLMAGPLGPDRRRRGASAVLLPFAHESFLAEHKSLNYLLGVFGKAFAESHGADEGLYVGASGMLHEGTSSSLFLVRDGSLHTVPAKGILPGVTRRRVIDLAVAAGIRAVERCLREADLFESDEAFLTSSLAEIVPVIRVEERKIGSGRPGPVTRRLQRLYGDAVERYRADRR
jgi:branched-chain amino acid aminotransferase